MVASSIITRVREMLNEPTAEFFTDAEILAWINLGYKKLIGHTGYYQSEKTDSTVAKQQQYTYASDVVRVKSVRFEDDPLIPMDWRDYIERFGSQDLANYSDPQHFIDYEEKLYLYPIPNDSSTTTAVSGTVTTAATTVTCGSTSDFPSFGKFIVESEVIAYTNLTTSAFLNCSRGAEGTTAVQHADALTITERDITYLYDGMPSDLVSTDTPVFPEQYHELLIWYATWMGKMKRKAINEAQVWKSEFEKGAELMKRWWKTGKPLKAIKDKDRYPAITP